MDRIKAMQVFVEVAKNEGFAPAARELGISTSAVSRQIQDLEDWMGAQLFNRTTRQLNLTETGQGLLVQCKNILNSIVELEHSAADSHSEPKGRLRITAPVYLSNLLSQSVFPAYILENPKVDFQLVAANRNVNLVEEGFDLAIRAGPLDDSTLIAREISRITIKLVASPAYEKKYGRPNHPDELEGHNCIVIPDSPYVDRWPIREKNSSKTFHAKGNVQVNTAISAMHLAIAGAGITILPAIPVAIEIKNKRLVSWLDEYIDFDVPLNVVYPQSRYVSRPVRSFIEHISKHINDF